MLRTVDSPVVKMNISFRGRGGGGSGFHSCCIAVKLVSFKKQVDRERIKQKLLRLTRRFRQFGH